nr:MAG TPA: hypothetical protein [Caudoviricetes sp.]
MARLQPLRITHRCSTKTWLWQTPHRQGRSTPGRPFLMWDFVS